MGKYWLEIFDFIQDLSIGGFIGSGVVEGQKDFYVNIIQQRKGRVLGLDFKVIVRDWVILIFKYIEGNLELYCCCL